MAADPFAALGLGADATEADVRAARRRLAFAHHPDRGGDPARMRAVNAAFVAAMGALAARARRAGVVVAEAGASSPAPPRSPSAGPARPPGPPGPSVPMPSRLRRVRTVGHDACSLVVHAAPADALRWLVAAVRPAAPTLFVEADDGIEAVLDDPPAWCRLEVRPEGLSTAVSLTIGQVDQDHVPTLDDVRDAVVRLVNALS